MAKIRLGSHVKELFNGKTGIAYERIIWLFGCDQIVVVPDKEYEQNAPIFGSRGLVYAEERLTELEDTREELIQEEYSNNQEKYFGKEVTDKVTGIKGIVIGRKVSLYSTDQYVIQPKASKKREAPEAIWVDEGRLTIIGEGVKPEEVTSSRPGGCEYIPTVYV